MPTEYELSDISVKYKSDTSLNEANTNSRKMHISHAKAFILAFLAIAIAVGVGIIVHFAGNGRTVECNCAYPTVAGSNTGTAAGLEQCKDWATEGNSEGAEICNACPSGAPVTCPPVVTTAQPATTATPDMTSTTQAPPVLDVRLPLTLEPLLYTVELQPHMYAPLQPSEFTFNGSVTVLIHCKMRTRNVTLHTNKLNISVDLITVERENDFNNLKDRVEFDLERQFIVIHTTEDLIPGQNYFVEIPSFVGPLVPDLAGLYLSSYNRGNETIHIATTQMQPTDARKTFPCMDEPAIKSEFKVTLVRKSHMTSISNMPVSASDDRYLATTLMAPIDARKTLPCFDEPSFRAAFDVTLVRKEPKISISNMPIKSSEPRGNGWIADHFVTTPKMSTYLLAFIICDFNYTQNVTKNNVTYRAWARPEAIEQTPYSLQVGVEILTYFEEYFKISYPLIKQDMIAIPDFAAGAMENWGLITYRETAMLYEKGVSSAGNKQRVAVVVSHELAHQWFGNLVTPSWWDDLWLNEGFASYVEYMGVHHVHEDWKMFEQFVVEDLQYVFRFDGLISSHPVYVPVNHPDEINEIFDRISYAKFDQFVVEALQDVFRFDGLISSHPVYVPVNHPDEINEIFDRISYAKGASIIRMMRFFLGDSVFKNGLTRYLNQLAYDAAFHDDLWFALGNQSIAENNAITNVKEIMDTWTLQMNYPIVHVTHTSANQITLTQSRYVQDRNATDPGIYTSPFGYTWNIPFTMTSSSAPEFNVSNDDVMMFTRNMGTMTIQSNNIPQPDGTNWVLGNPMQYGYYRVNYEERNWLALINQLKTNHMIIHPINRAQIMNDAWNLVKSGDLRMEIALQTIEYLDKEREYVPWAAATEELSFVSSMLQTHRLYGSFSEFMRNKTRAIFQELTMNNTDAQHLESYIRSTISSLACEFGITECIDEAKRLFSEWMSNPSVNPIDPGLKSTVYCKGVAEGGINEWEFALNQYRTANVAAEKSRLLYALACTREPWILSQYLQMSVNPDEIRRQDTVSVMVAIAGNVIGRPLAWDFFRSNWDFLLNDYLQSSGPFTLPGLISGVTKRFNNKFDLKELKEFVESRDSLGSGERAFAQALEKTQSNINWMEANVPKIETWLKNAGY